MYGFTFNGIHSSEFGVEYIPDAAARWWDDAEFEIYKKDVPWKNGGYWYGNAASMRSIDLNCYFEEISIATREKIRRWLGREKHGMLILDDRPFIAYEVYMSDIIPGKIYNDTGGTYSGTMTAKFIAPNPFGYLLRKSNTGYENDNAEDYCGIIASSMMPSPPNTASRIFDVYNPGTEACGLSIVIAGSCSHPIRFINQRNQTKCVISSLPTNSLRLEIDGDTGFVKTYASGSQSNYSEGFAYHDYGIVRLEPDETYTGVTYTAVANGTGYDLTLTGVKVTEDMLNAYIQFNSPATRNARVTAVNEDANKVTVTLGGSGAFQTSGALRLSTMNHIAIEEQNDSGNWVTPTTLGILAISVDYKPRLL